MSQSMTKKYPAAFKERAVQLAVESEQSIAQTARDLGRECKHVAYLERAIAPC